MKRFDITKGLGNTIYPDRIARFLLFIPFHRFFFLFTPAHNCVVIQGESIVINHPQIRYPSCYWENYSKALKSLPILHPTNYSFPSALQFGPQHTHRTFCTKVRWKWKLVEIVSRFVVLVLLGTLHRLLAINSSPNWFAWKVTWSTSVDVERMEAASKVCHLGNFYRFYKKMIKCGHLTDNNAIPNYTNLVWLSCLFFIRHIFDKLRLP